MIARENGYRAVRRRPRISTIARRVSGAVATIFLAAGFPAAEAQTVAACPAEMDAGLTGLAGVVRDSAYGVTIPDATVYASWDDDLGQRRTRFIDTDRQGTYLLCGLPPRSDLAVHAEFIAFESEPVMVTIAPGPPAGWDIAIRVDKALGNPGRIVGRVTDRRSGRPVPGARVGIEDQHERAVLTDRRGVYGFKDIEPGLHKMSFDHLAFEPVDQVVYLPSDITVEVDFEVTGDTLRLEPLVVTAVREKRLEMQGFYERRTIGEAVGGGLFVTREDIRKESAIRVTHFLGRLPSVRTACSGAGNNNCQVLMTRGRDCSASVYLDGVLVIGRGRGGDSIDNFVSPAEIAAIEVYRGPSELPAEFGGSDGQCGAVVIWTGVVSQQ